MAAVLLVGLLVAGATAARTAPAVVVSSGAPPARTAPAGAASSGTVAARAPAATPAAAGTIRGRAEVKVRPPRRTPRRYPGGGAGPAKRLQPLPAVVYVKAAPPVAGAADRPTMAQRDTAFHPSVLVVRRGTEVGFPNHDDFFHNVFSYSDAERFDLGRYPKGETKTVVFDETGVVKVYCEVHEFMRSAVIVTESGLHGVVAEDGSFSISGVPAGRRTVVLWHADLGETEAEVVVPEGGAVDVELEVG